MVSAAKRLSPATCLEPRRGRAGRGLSARAIISAPPRLRVNPFHFILRDLCASARIPFALSPEDTANQNGLFPCRKRLLRLYARRQTGVLPVEARMNRRSHVERRERSEERRVGKECGSTGRFRGS